MLARRTLQWQSKELLVDERNIGRLGREIGTVLGLIRDCHPAMEEITARQSPTELRLNIVGALLDDLAGRWTDLSAGAVFPTGHAAFDGLSARLGLRTIQFRPASDLVVLRFGGRANPRATVKAYSAIADVAHARRELDLIDGSNIDVRKMGGSWHAVMRKA